MTSKPTIVHCSSCGHPSTTQVYSDPSDNETYIECPTCGATDWGFDRKEGPNLAYFYARNKKITRDIFRSFPNPSDNLDPLKISFKPCYLLEYSTTANAYTGRFFRAYRLKDQSVLVDPYVLSHKEIHYRYCQALPDGFGVVQPGFRLTVEVARKYGDSHEFLFAMRQQSEVIGQHDFYYAANYKEGPVVSTHQQEIAKVLRKTGMTIEELKALFDKEQES